MISIADSVQELGIFQELTPAEIDSLSDGIFVREVPTGTVLYRPEDEGREIYVLIEGQVDLYRLTLGGRRLVTGRVRPGAIIGEMALLGHVPRGGFAEAIEDSRVCVVDRACMQRIISLHPEVAERILLATYAHLEELKQRLEHASFSSVKVRLAHFLRGNMDRATGDVSGFTHADIGDTIGALRQTVTETLGELRHLGLVEVRHKRVTVLDVERLERLDLEQESARERPGLHRREPQVTSPSPSYR